MNKAEVTKRIAQRAFELFEARGGEHGYDMSDWLTAEKEITGRITSTDGKFSSTKKREVELI